MRAKKAYFQIRRKFALMIHGHILNPIWHSRAKRRYKRELVMKASLLQYLNLYKSDVERFRPCVEKIDAEKERVFTMWLQGEENAPEIVKACLRSMRRNLDLDLTVLDESNLFDWISLPDYIVSKWRSGKMSTAHFSDLCRVEALYRHGGIWLDSTAFVTANIPEKMLDSDFFVYRSGDKLGGWYAYIQNCFIRAKKYNPLLTIWRYAMYLYWKSENKALNYYIHQFLFEFVTTNNTIASESLKMMPDLVQDPTHLLWYGHRDDPYDENTFMQLTSEAFFQKTNYKDKASYAPKPGTMAYHILNS